MTPRMHPDARRTRLRGLMTKLGSSLEATGESRDAFRELVTALDLGPETDVRTCPNCGAIAFSTATICSECWHALKAA